MAWTEITRRQYRRDGLRYASDLTDAEWALIGAVYAAAFAGLDGPAKTDLRVGGGRDPLYRLDGLPMAAIAEGFSALFDRAGLFLRMVARRDLSRRSIIIWSWRRESWPGEASPTAGVIDSQIGQNHGKRRSARL